MGDHARANGNNNLALGTNARAEKVTETVTVTKAGTATTTTRLITSGPVNSAIAMGHSARANGDNTVVIGGNALAEARVAQAISTRPDGTLELEFKAAPATSSTVIGGLCQQSQGTNNVVIGSGADDPR